VVNRVQKLRKKAGLAATDQVEVYIDFEGQPGGPVLQALTAQQDYVAASLGMPILPAQHLPKHAVRGTAPQNCGSSPVPYALEQRLTMVNMLVVLGNSKHQT
jgi:hypothetical protein